MKKLTKKQIHTVANLFAIKQIAKAIKALNEFRVNKNYVRQRKSYGTIQTLFTI